jgi:hypothetical protein
LAALILITSQPYPGRRSPFFAPSLWHAAEVALSPWSRRCRSGPPPWPGRRYAHAFALALCNHARTHVPVPSRATMRALAWRGQGPAFGSLSRLTSSALRPATGRGFAADGNPSSPEARAPTRSRSCTLTLAHTRTNPVVALTPRAKLKHPVRDRPVALLHLAAEDVLPPRRTSVRPSQCTCSSTHTHVGEHPGVPSRSSPPWPSHLLACALK